MCCETCKKTFITPKISLYTLFEIVFMLNKDKCIVLPKLKFQDKSAVWQTYTLQLLANAHTFGQTLTLFLMTSKS